MKTSLFLLSTLFVSTTWAGLRCENTFTAVPLRDSAVEIEISGAIADRMFTTTDGTIGPVISPLGEAAIPPVLLKQIKESFPGEAVESLSWDLLTQKEKESLILYSTKQRKQNFFQDRNVQGLIYRDQIELVFKESSEFMGRSYPAGKHVFNSQDLFANTKIEFSGPKGMVDNLGFEIHVRRPDGADKNLVTSTRLQKSLVGYASSVHQHVVAPIPLEALAENPEMMAFKLMDLYRRVSLHAQLLRVTRGHSVEELTATSGDYSYINMPLLEKADLVRLDNYFLNLGRYLKAEKQKLADQKIREEGTLKERFKLWARNFFKGQDKMLKFLKNPLEEKIAEKSGLVGMRAGKVYDGETLLWGMELRDLAQSHNQKHLGDFLRSVQTRMLIGDYGLKDSTVNAVLNDNSGVKLVDRIYYEPIADLKNDPTGGKLEGSKNEALGLLLHNWNKDPLFVEHPEFLPKLEEARKIALESIKRGEAPTEALQRFATRSGLHYLLWESLRID